MGSTHTRTSSLKATEKAGPPPRPRAVPNARRPPALGGGNASRVISLVCARRRACLRVLSNRGHACGSGGKGDGVRARPSVWPFPRALLFLFLFWFGTTTRLRCTFLFFLSRLFVCRRGGRTPGHAGLDPRSRASARQSTLASACREQQQLQRRQRPRRHHRSSPMAPARPSAPPPTPRTRTWRPCSQPHAGCWPPWRVIPARWTGVAAAAAAMA